MRIAVWGTYDLGKPRVRILLRGLREVGVDVVECHQEIWSGIEDKSQIRGVGRKLRLGLRWIAAYPRLIYGYLRLPRHDAVLVCYLGQLDVLVLWPFAKLRRTPIVWDAFLSLYDTVVEDRRLVSRRHPLALALFALEWLGCRAATRIVLDTAAHGSYFSASFSVAAAKISRVFVGAETELFHANPASGDGSNAAGHQFTVLFYGQFIPLHGIEHVVRAAKLCDDLPVRWVLIGNGQEAAKIHELIAELRPAHLEWVEWVPYAQLRRWILRADVCLGIFGDTGKALRVIPNKVFQILASGRSLITEDSPAARELLRVTDGVALVPPADPEELAAAVRRSLFATRPIDGEFLRETQARITPKAIGVSFLNGVLLPLKTTIRSVPDDNR